MEVVVEAVNAVAIEERRGDIILGRHVDRDQRF
jgi:hypothetical protein